MAGVKATTKKQQASEAVEQQAEGLFSMDELGLMFKAVMDMPLRRSEKGFQIASGVLAKLQAMSLKVAEKNKTGGGSSS